METLIPVLSALLAAGGTAVVALLNGRSAERQSRLGPYDSLAEQVVDQQEQITGLFEQVTQLSRRIVLLETREQSWQAWADDLNRRWDVYRLEAEPPGFPTTKL